MAQEKIGEVTTPTNATFYVYWDKDTGKIHVGNEYAGKASSKQQALTKATIYATTGKTQ